MGWDVLDASNPRHAALLNGAFPPCRQCVRLVTNSLSQIFDFLQVATSFSATGYAAPYQLLLIGISLSDLLKLGLANANNHTAHAFQCPFALFRRLATFGPCVLLGKQRFQTLNKVPQKMISMLRKTCAQIAEMGAKAISFGCHVFA